MKQMKSRLPLAVLAMSIAAFVLRFCLYLFGTDHKGLLVAGHPLEIILWLLTAAVSVLVVALVWKDNQSHSYAANFPASLVPALGCFALAVGILLTVLESFFAFSILELLRNVSGLLAVPALMAVAFCRKLGKRPFFAFHALVCLALTLHTVSHYSSWSSCPQLQDAFFPMMGCIGLMLFAYYQTAFDADMGSRRMQRLTGLLAVFACFAAIPCSDTALLYLTGGIWTLTNLCASAPKTETEEEDVK